MGKRPISHKVIKDNIVSLAFAIGDTTCSALTWFFRLLLKLSHVETKIREKLRKVLSVKEAKPSLVFSTEDLSKMVSLHAALCETPRLFPPVPNQSRTAMKQDILPSGHHVSIGYKV
jgi:cytochrome P450